MKEPLLRTTARGVYPLLVVSRYLLINADGTVLALDKMHWGEDGNFAIKLPERLPPGEYKVCPRHFPGRQFPATVNQDLALPRRRARGRRASGK